MQADTKKSTLSTDELDNSFMNYLELFSQQLV